MSFSSADGRGFTLIEMALVLLLLGVMTRAAIVPLGDLVDHRKRQAAEQQLAQIRQAVIAHVIAFGALPCPVATTNKDRLESSKAIDRKTHPRQIDEPCLVGEGGVPAITLGLAGSLSEQQALLDPWGREYLFAVSLNSHDEAGDPMLADWTTPGEAARIGVGNLSAELVLCQAIRQGRCSGSEIRANQIAFVVLSSGQNQSHSAGETENLDEDVYFFLVPESVESGAEFDDQLVWANAAEIMYWLLKTGWLP